MTPIKRWKSILAGSACVAALSSNAFAAQFDIPAGDLNSALSAFSAQTGVQLVMSYDAVKGARSRGVKGDLAADVALTRILANTGFSMQRRPTGAVAIVPNQRESTSERVEQITPIHVAATAMSAGVESVVVTSSKIKGDIQTVPIAITALSQEQLTQRQIAGGPDLVKEVPNLTFSKTNFTGYNIQIRGIGTQAISVSTDPAVAVAFNDTPFIRNHFFEQEFFDVSQVEVLRGPQGTLYGRNATAGVVNVVSAKPTDQFEAMVSADIGNYHNRRFEGMVNIPIVGDTLDLRVAGEWTKRDGYSTNDITGNPIDGRNLWSSRVSLRWKPAENVTADFVWEHFQENDDRMRSAKQLCKRGTGPATVLGVSTAVGSDRLIGEEYLNQGCDPVSLYSPDAFGVPNALMLPYYGGLVGAGFGLALASPLTGHPHGYDPYASTTQSHNLRAIESTIDPTYRAKNDTLEFNAEWNVTPSLTFNSQTGYNRDFLWSTEDFNRFNTVPGTFLYYPPGSFDPSPEIIPEDTYVCQDGSVSIGAVCNPSTYKDNSGVPPNGAQAGIYCDPQLGCADRLVAEDLSNEHAWQFSQEFRLASNFSGPFNFSFGGNFLHYETEENYYVFINSLSMYMQDNNDSGDSSSFDYGIDCLHSYAYPNLTNTGFGFCTGGYMDPNPINRLNGQGHNYFVSKNPYVLNSYAGFGEVYYTVTPELKLTGGLRWTVDKKHFTDIPSELLIGNDGTGGGYGYPSVGTVDQQWKKWTGRFVANWSPKLDFTDQSMFYASYSRGYKAGGANPPGAQLLSFFGTGSISTPTHPLTFKPEFVDAFELGTKNTLLDGSLTFNADAFYYNYKGYQISRIVDRTAINDNFDATVKGAEVEATYEPLPGLKFSFAGGYEDARAAKGDKSIDLMDRTAGNPDWILVKPSPTQASNCILPAYVVAYMLGNAQLVQGALTAACGIAYANYDDPVTQASYVADPFSDYHGFDPLAGAVDPLTGTIPDPYTGQNKGAGGYDYGPAPNNGAGFDKDLSGKQLPNAPHFTLSLSGDYTMPVSANWAATLHGDFYWQSQSWARIFNTVIDKIRGYSNVNAALILTDASGWQVMGYVKNVFDKTAITGTFLNSDDTALTTNVFLTDPRLYGVRVTKNFDGGDSTFDLFSGAGRPQLWLTLGGNFSQLNDGWQKYNPSFISAFPEGGPTLLAMEKTPGAGFDREGNLAFQPTDSDWSLKASIRYGRSGTDSHHQHKTFTPQKSLVIDITGFYCSIYGICSTSVPTIRLVDGNARASEKHTMLDYTVGKDVGFRVFGSDGKGTIGAGVRMVQFSTRASADLKAQPDWYAIGSFPTVTINHDVFDGITDEHRSFHGTGPEATWDAEEPVFGSPEGGQVTLDWGANAAVLFGRQRADLHQTTSKTHCFSGLGVLQTCPKTTTTNTILRSRKVTVPNLGGYVGASVRYHNAKVSFGYRADMFFNAIDGGQATAAKENRGFYGPYLNLSVGFGD